MPESFGYTKASKETMAERKATLIIESKSFCPHSAPQAEKKDKGRKM
jgi:hypothetical protein